MTFKTIFVGALVAAAVSLAATANFITADSVTITSAVQTIVNQEIQVAGTYTLGTGRTLKSINVTATDSTGTKYRSTGVPGAGMSWNSICPPSQGLRIKSCQDYCRHGGLLAKKPGPMQPASVCTLGCVCSGVV